MMGRKVIDRTGEERINSFGSKMIIKDLLCELFLENISDRVVEEFLIVRENVQMDEFINIYKETLGENAFSFLLGF